MDETQIQTAPLWRRIGAIFYDSLLLTAVLFVATALVLPFNQGVAISADSHIFQLYLLAVSFLYFGWFWTHGGQTLGMRVWQVRALNDSGRTLSWWQSLLRFGAAILSWLSLGLGFLWMLWGHNGRTWHDKLSGTKLVLVRRAD